MLFEGILRSEVPIEAPTNYNTKEEYRNKDRKFVKPSFYKVKMLANIVILDVVVISWVIALDG